MARSARLRLVPPGAGRPFTAVERATLLSIPIVAERLGTGRRTVYRLIERGVLPVVHQTGAMRVRLVDLVSYVEGL
jgi:excisionase family DNA binding protein